MPSEDEHFEEDLDDDEDWTMDRKKKPAKKASEKTTPKRYLAITIYLYISTSLVELVLFAS